MVVLFFEMGDPCERTSLEGLKMRAELPDDENAVGLQSGVVTTSHSKLHEFQTWLVQLEN